MKSTPVLPGNYKEIYALDLNSDKKLALLVNGLALIISVVMAVVMLFIVPVSTLFRSHDDQLHYWFRLGVLVAGMFVYIVLHEAVHGIAMKLCGCKNVRFGVKGTYAFASTDYYIAKKPYVVIALAPVVVWGVVLTVINCLVPVDWFWVVYIIQIINISGAAGDLYVTGKFLRLPPDILIRDYGVGMTVYSAQ